MRPQKIVFLPRPKPVPANQIQVRRKTELHRRQRRDRRLRSRQTHQIFRVGQSARARPAQLSCENHRRKPFKRDKNGRPTNGAQGQRSDPRKNVRSQVQPGKRFSDGGTTDPVISYFVLRRGGRLF